MGLPQQITTPADYRVRPARVRDIGAIQSTARASWTAAYGAIQTPETLAGYLAKVCGTPALRATLRSRKSTFLVAVRGESVLGFCHFGERPAENRYCIAFVVMYDKPHTGATSSGELASAPPLKLCSTT